MDKSLSFSGLCVSSSQGSGGKTLVSLGLARALLRKNRLVKTYKKGPDYIDAAWLARASHFPATNLDPFFLKPTQLAGLFYTSLYKASQIDTTKEPFALVEGNRGLYDGLDEAGSFSTARLARLLKLPILLTLNCEKVTRTMAAIIKGLTSFETNLEFCGLVLNRVGSSRHANALRQTIEANTDLKIIGILPRLSYNPLPERHMGIASYGAGLNDKADQLLEGLADYIEKYCNLNALLSSLAFRKLQKKSPKQQTGCSKQLVLNSEPKPKIGYIKDAAFWFYYPENLEALEAAGAELVKLQIINAEEKELKNWEQLDGLYLGGGFPEDFAAELEKSPLLDKIHKFAHKDMPIYAECGGLMLLARHLIFNSGTWKMCGIFPYDIHWSEKPQGLGYIEGEVRKKNPFFPVGKIIRGHEFHYSSLIPTSDMNFGLLLKRGNGLYKKVHNYNNDSNNYNNDALIYKNVWASYCHIFAQAIPCWAKNFVEAARVWHKTKKKFL